MSNRGHPDLPLLPVPARVVRTEAEFSLPRRVRYQLSSAAGSATESAVQRLSEKLDLSAAADGPVELRIEVRQPGPEFPVLGEDESHTLSIAPTGITIRATRPSGAIRALTTLQQLIARQTPPDVRLPCVEIEDRPRFPWRGLMIDVSRHFIPVPVILRLLGAMAGVKLNVLHLHLTDDQGFRLESLTCPELHRRGSDGDYYTQDEIRRIVDHAADRGIRVVPEFDLPGHASSWLAGYPHLGCRPNDAYFVSTEWGHHDVCLDPTSDEVYAFLERFFADVLPLFPDEVVHVGGDEVSGEEWRATPHVVDFMRAHGIETTAALQARFNVRVREIVGRFGKRIMGWDEVVHPDVPTDTIVQSWRGPESVDAITRSGYPCVQSHGYYLDALLPAREHYRVDPVPDSLADAQARRVLGGEACMWTEFADAETIEGRIWPRAMAVAERLWSPPDVRNEQSFAMRALQQDVGAAARGQRLATRLGAESVPLQLVVDLMMPAPLETANPEARRRLDRLSDHLPIESFQIVYFGSFVSGDGALATSFLQMVTAACEAVDTEFAGSRILADLGPLVGRLRVAAQIGIRALDAAVAIRAGHDQRQPRESVKASLDALTECAAPHEGVVVGIVEPIRRLVCAVGVAPQ